MDINFINLGIGYGVGLLTGLGVLIGYMANRGLSGVASDVLDIKDDLAKIKSYFQPAQTSAKPATVTTDEITPSSSQ